MRPKEKCRRERYILKRKISLEVNADKTKYLFTSRYQNAGGSHVIKTDTSCFESVEEFRYFEAIVTNPNSIQVEIKNRLYSNNARYHPEQNLLFCSLLSNNLNNKIHRIVTLIVVLYGCETWSLTLLEKRKLRVSENRVLRRIFGDKRDEVTRERKKLHNEELNDPYSS